MFKKSLTKILIAFGLATIVLNSAPVFAAGYLPIENKANQVFVENQVPAPPQNMTGQKIVEEVVLKGLGYVKVIVVAVGILFLTIMGFMLVIRGDQEEQVTESKKAIIYTIVAFVLISMAEDIGRIFDMRTGTILGSPQEILNRVRLFDKQVEIAITFTKYVLGAFASLMLVQSAVKLITAGGNEEEASKNRMHIVYALGGLALIYVGQVFIEKVLYKVNKNVYSGITGVHPKFDAKAGVEQIAGITNFIVSFVGPIGVIVLLAGGIMYATARGEEDQTEKAKRILIAAIIGLIIIYGAFAIVSTVLAGQLQDIGAFE